MDDNMLAVAEDSDGPHGPACMREGSALRSASRPSGKREVVLDVGVRADVLFHRGPVAGLKRFENGDRFFFVFRF